MLNIVGTDNVATGVVGALKTSPILQRSGSRIALDDESVAFAEQCLYRAIRVIGDGANKLIVKRGDEISASYRGSVVMQHFDTGLSLELSLHRPSAGSEWMIDGGVWRRNEDASGILPSVDVRVPWGADADQIENAVVTHLGGLLACCKPLAWAQQNALEMCA